MPLIASHKITSSAVSSFSALALLMSKPFKTALGALNKCLFNDFFRAHGAPELTSIVCTLDSIWIEELHRPPYKVRFERPTTLARGDDACRFQFSRTTAAQQGVSRDASGAARPRRA
jgi:hypothetical protein